jgi:sugar phosphate isomerase/epimerase
MKQAQSHLTYCTNIHAGESWPEVRDNLRTHVAAVKEILAPDEPFGVGLRLSARAAESLEAPAALAELRDLLDASGLYVFTLNGFPYGPFHGQPVKAAVYRPDWSEPARGVYTDRLVRLLAALLPEGQVGSISTVPAGFRQDLREPAQLEHVAAQLIEQVACLSELRRESGREITLALEPEPRCLLETTAETIAFFEQHLLSGSALGSLGRRLGVPPAEAESELRRHLGVCLDTCHAAIEFEEPDDTLDQLLGAGLGIFKIQLSAGLSLSPSASALSALAEYDEPVYLHQVVARCEGGQLLRFDDLPEALASEAARRAAEWRVHFHVPLYRRSLGAFENTQLYLARVLERQREHALSAHLEVETYTWDVLPPAQRQGGVVASIARELSWVRERLQAPASASP